jgi:hypothetical protein
MPSDLPPSPDELLHVTDPGAPLPGEDPESMLFEDAVHWTRVYGELLALKASLLERADQMVRGMSDDAMKEADIDQRLLRAQAGRYRVRHRYWTLRADELSQAEGRAPGVGAG